MYSLDVEQLLINLVHDLRQPLGNIETSAYCLNRSADASEGRTAEYLRTIERQADRANELLNEVSAELRRRRTHSVATDNLPLTKSVTAAVT